MNKVLIACVLVSFIYAISAANTPSPLFLWSGKQLFSKQKVNVGSLKSEQFTKTLGNICGLNKGEQNKIKVDNQIVPEVTVFFLKPELTNSKFSSLADVYNKKRKGGSFEHLMGLVDSSKSSLSVHYSFTEKSFIEDVVSNFGKDLISKYPETSVVLTSNRKADVSHFSEMKNHKWVSLNKFEDFISSEEGRKLLRNETPDIIIYYLSENDDSSSVSQEDRAISRVNQVINIATNGNYLSIFSSDLNKKTDTFKKLRSVKHEQVVTEHVLRSNQFGSMMENGNSTASTYFPAQIWESIFASLILLFAFLVGTSCISTIQVPPKLLDEAMAKRKLK